MFKELGQIMGLAKQLPKIKEEMDRLQERLGQITGEGDAGGGMVKVRANGKLEVLSCVVSEEARKLGDWELLEDLITSAVNQALQKARHLAVEESGKLATGLGLPTGMNLPGMQ